MKFSLASPPRQRVSNMAGQTHLERKQFSMHTVLSCQFWKRMLSCNVGELGSFGERTRVYLELVKWAVPVLSLRKSKG
jgi:hypothetical protein